MTVPCPGSGLLREWLAAGCSIFMRPNNWKTFVSLPATGWSRSGATASGNTAFESTISGESASLGVTAKRMTWKSSTIIEAVMAKRTKLLEPIHPGEILSEDFMRPLALSINRLSRDLGVPPTRIHGIVRGTRAITADTALRLGAYFGVAAETWLNLQTEYDLRIARQTSGEEIARTVRKRTAA
jgi:antitoxin HigA-1